MDRIARRRFLSVAPAMTVLVSTGKPAARSISNSAGWAKTTPPDRARKQS